jgi:flagellar motor protein MotB
METKKVTLNEEISRMRVLAGIPSNENAEIVEEGILSKIAMGLGIGLMSLTNVLAQTGQINRLRYDKDKMEALENAMEDPQVQNKLKELGVKDNNIKREIELIKGRKVTGYQEKTATSQKELKKLMALGWHLTSVQSDTVINTVKAEHPSADVDTISFRLDEETMFASGRFILSDADRSNILAILDSIEQSGSNLLGVTVISSTDKQQLTKSLQQILSSLGYSPDNKGLSAARNDGVTSVLASIGIDSSIITQKKLFEQGGPTIDQSARYVAVIFDVIKLPVAPGEKSELGKEYSVKSTYELFKPVFNYGTIKVGKYKTKVCKTKALKYDRKSTPSKCFFGQDEGAK